MRSWSAAGGLWFGIVGATSTPPRMPARPAQVCGSAGGQGAGAGDGGGSSVGGGGGTRAGLTGAAIHVWSPELGANVSALGGAPVSEEAYAEKLRAAGDGRPTRGGAPPGERGSCARRINSHQALPQRPSGVAQGEN